MRTHCLKVFYKYNGHESIPSSKLFAQFTQLKPRKGKEILSEIKDTHSRLRVIFATTAMAMGIDAISFTLDHHQLWSVIFRK